ncbi:hypothetical protein ES707_08061 [subsurface metagenome]
MIISRKILGTFLKGGKMDGFFYSIVGGSIPALVMVVVYFLSTEKRLTRIETDLTWIKKELPGCQQPLDKSST